MSSLMEFEQMAKSKGRPRKPAGEGSQVRIDPDLATQARYIVARDGINLIDYLSSILRPAIERDFKRVAPKVDGGAK